MKKIELSHIVEKEKEGTYYSIPFSVPAGLTSLTVRYSYPKLACEKSTKVNIIDLGLEDNQGHFLGWSGSSRKEVTVGEFSSTPGYMMQPIEEGEWHILIGAYHVAEQGVKVTYEICFEEKKAEWLFGDFHVHSDASDGQYDIPTLAKMAKQKELDFLAVTNHNNYVENFSLPKVAGLTLIPGVEWTHYLGHMNFFGIKQPFFGSFVANDAESMQKIIAGARENGALISVNHPKCPICPYLWEDEECFQVMEVWNGPMRKANVDAMKWWHGLLKKGRQIVAIGGSDYHRSHDPVKLGNPVTAVYSESKSVDDIMNAVRAGHCYVLGKREGVQLSLSCEGAMMGDTVFVQDKVSVQICAEHMPGSAVLFLVGENGIIGEWKAKEHRIEADVEVTKTSFVYLAAVSGRKNVLAISNPIYMRKGN